MNLRIPPLYLRLVLAFGLTLCGAFYTQPASGLQLANDAKEVSWRFFSGNGTANPTPNTDPTFVGLGYDWSPIGGIGWGGNGRLRNGEAMISPINFEGAAHYGLSAGTNVDFFDGVTSARRTATVTLYENPGSDVLIQTVAKPFAASDNIGVLRLLDISTRNYAGQAAFILGTGSNSVLGKNTGTQQIATTHIYGLNNDTMNPYSQPGDTYKFSEVGDSGSPLLIPYKGQLTMAGSTWYGGGASSTLLSTSWDPVTPTNKILARDGYALRYFIYDIPSDTLNTANVWSGGAGTSAFNATANWNQSAVPSNVPVVFDSSATNGQKTVNLGGNRQLRGILFRSNTNTLTGGITIAAGGTLSLGYTGVRNEDSNTNVINSDIQLTNSQNWEAVNGDLVINGNISNNGFLTVIQGARTTTLGGTLFGTGGLAKDETGTLVLSGHSTYTGQTFLHDGTIRLGTNDALPTNADIRFDVGNPNATLDINGRSQTVGAIRSFRDGTGIIAVNGGSLTVGNGNASGIFTGVLTGPGLVTKTGFGTWILGGYSSSYTGSLNVRGGAIQLLAGSALNGPVSISNGGILQGAGSIGGAITLSDGSIAPGVAGIGTLIGAQGLTWNAGGRMSYDLGAPGSSDILNLGSTALSKGTLGNYAFSFSNTGGAAPGLYTLINFGSTSFKASDFLFTNTGSFAGNFVLTGSSLQLQLLAAGSVAGGGWNNFTNGVTVYDAPSNWINGGINNLFTEKIPNGFNQQTIFNNSTTLTGGITINVDSLTAAPSYVNTAGWAFLSKLGVTTNTLTLGGDITVNNLYSRLSPLATGGSPSGSFATPVALGAIGGITSVGSNFAAIDLGGSTRTISSNIGADSLVGTTGFFIDAPITDAANTGAGVIKTGYGSVVLGAANTFTGPLDIRQGTVLVLNQGVLSSTSITISGGGELFLSNNSRDYNSTAYNYRANRLSAGSNLTLNLKGGDLTFYGGNILSAPETETIGIANVQQGVSILNPIPISGKDNVTIAINALNHSPGTVLVMGNLTSGGVASGGAYVKATTIDGNAPVNGKVLPWAYLGNGYAYSSFAVYSGTLGFQASNSTNNPNYLSGTTFAGATAASDYQQTANYTLTGDASVNSLTMGGTITGSGSQTLTIGSGGVLVLGGNIATGLTVDFNNSEAIFGVSYNVNSSISSPIRNANGLTFTSCPGNASLALNFANPFNSNGSQTQYNWGTTSVNIGRLIVQNAAALPNTGNVVINTGASNINAQFRPGSQGVLDLYGNSITIGALSGNGIVDFASLINTKTGVITGTMTLGNGGGSGAFSGTIQDSLLPVIPYGAYQGTLLTTYTSNTGNIPSLGIVKTGAGTQTLSGSNTYTGTTTVTGGTLALSDGGTLGLNSALSLVNNGSTFDVSASTGIPAIGSLSGALGTIVKLGGNTLSVGGNANTTFSGTVQGTGGLQKRGAGMLTFDGVNNATGSTVVNSGILRLDHASNGGSLLSNSSPLVMGGGILQSVGGGADQTAGLTVNAGGSAIQTGSNGGISFGAVSRNGGGTVDFSGANIATSASANSFIGWGTANGMSDWAAVSGSGTVVAASTVGGIEAIVNDASAWSASANVVNNGAGFSGWTASSGTVNSIFFKGGHSSTVNVTDSLQIASGGILESAAVGNNASTISGGALSTGNGKDLVVIQNNTASPLTIASTLYGPGGLTKSGAGTLILAGADTLIGATNVNAGRIALTGASTLGSTSPLNVAANAIADLSGSTATQGFSQISGNGNIILSPRDTNIGADDSSSSFGGMLTGSGSLTKNGGGTLTLSGLNTYTGATNINTGMVAVTGNGTLGLNSAVTVSSGNASTATLDLSAATSPVWLGSLSGAGNVVLSGVGMVVGSDNTSTAFSGFLTGFGGLTKVGSGNFTFSGANYTVSNGQYNLTVSGGLTIDGGTVLLDYTSNLTYKLQGQNGGPTNLGGGTLALVGNAVTPFGDATYGFVVNPGASSISLAVPANAAAKFALTSFHFNRNAGGTLDMAFTPATTGSGSAVLATSVANTNGILGGYATVNGMSDFATVQSGSIAAAAPSILHTPAYSSTSVQGTLTATSGYVSVPTGTAGLGLAVGQSVYGPGIPAGSTITIITSTAFYINKPITLGGSQSLTVVGISDPNASQLTVGQVINGPNIPAGSTVSSIVGSYVTISGTPTGSVSQYVVPGSASGTISDQGYTVATMDNPANWTTANYGSTLPKANLTDSAGFNGTAAASTTINSLRINATAPASIGIASGQTLTIASGGILETSAVGANAVNISGGTLATGNNADLIFIQNNPAAPMTVSSNITGNGVTKSGSGTLILAGNNPYTGPTTVNSGTLALGGASTVGNGSAVTVMPGATLDLQNSTSATQSFGSLSSVSTGGGTGGGTVILGSSISTLTVGSNNTNTLFSGSIQNGAGSSAGLTKIGTGVLALGGSNSYTGPTLINGGTLMLALGGVLTSNVTVGNGSAIAGLAGIGTVGDVTIDSTSSTKYGVLTPGIPIIGPFTLQTAGMLTTNNLTLGGPNAQINFTLGSSALAGTTYSTIAVNGNLTLAGAVLNLTAVDAFGPGTYHLFTYTGTETGTLTLGTLPTGFNSSQFSISYSGGSVDLVASPKAVPEPSTWAMLACGLLLLGIARLRTRLPAHGA